MTGATTGGERPILITGRDGQLGFELVRALATVAPVIATTRASLDLADAAQIRDVVARLRPRLIINAAAYTAVDRAEAEEGIAFAINARAPGVLAEEAARLNVPLIHYSTDYVFDGSGLADASGGGQRPYRESDPTAPIGIYGRSKRAGEEAVLAAGGAALIFRTAWLYGERGRNFLLTMLRLAAERDEVRVVDDQVGCPTWARLVAEATAQIIAATGAAAGGASALGERQGIYHLACGGATSWHGFAAEIFSAVAAAGRRAPRLTPIPTRDYPTPAARPAYSVLDGAAVRRAFAVEMPDWRIGLALCLEPLLATPAG
jgi:dTDP-4-dehydrorhamnose reductase